MPPSSKKPPAESLFEILRKASDPKSELPPTVPGARNIIQAAADSVEDTAPIETTPPVEVAEEAAPTVETVEEDSEVETWPEIIPLKAPTQEWLDAQENLRDVGARAQERRQAQEKKY